MRTIARAVPAWLAGFLAMLAGTLAAQPAATAFTYQGRLTESGQPATGLYDFQACLYDAEGGNEIGCVPDLADVPVDAGLFTFALDFGSAPFNGQTRWLELRVRPGASTGTYTRLNPRQPVRPAPEALRANAASAAPWSGLSGVPAGFADGTDDVGGAGTVTSITAGTGLSGGTITGSGTIGIANGGVGSAQIAAGAVGSAQIASGAVGAAQIDAAQVQARVSGGCAVGQYVRTVNADGSVACGSDAVGGAGTVTSVTAGTGLSGGTITGSGTIGIASGGVGSAQIAAGAIGLAQINTTQVQARIGGTCAVGEYFRGVNLDGSVACEPVPGVPRITTVDDPPANNVGSYTSIAIGTDGLPVISYRDGTALALKVVKCGNAACTNGNTITTVDDPPANNVGIDNSIAVGSDGRPVISYRDFTAGSLKVAHCGNAACTSGNTITIVDDPLTNSVGGFTSIAIGTDGMPVVSYYDATANALKVAKCGNVACTGTATITTVDAPPSNDVGLYTSIAIGTDGLPVISYQDFTAGDLKVAKCANAACTGTTAITTVDATNAVGWHTSIAVGADGLPVISYWDGTTTALKVAKCASAACTGMATITTLDANLGELFTSIDIGTDGLPVISYFDNPRSLKVAKCANSACTGTATITTVDASGSSVGMYTSIAIGTDGLPVISYHDLTADALKVAKCGTRSCQ